MLCLKFGNGKCMILLKFVQGFFVKLKQCRKTCVLHKKLLGENAPHRYAQLTNFLLSRKTETVPDYHYICGKLQILILILFIRSKTLIPLIFRMYKMIVKNGKDLMEAENQ